MNSTSMTKKSSSTQKSTTAPGTYMEQAEVALTRAGVVLINTDVRQWLEQQQAAGVEVSQLADKWKEPENAKLAGEMKDIARIVYVTEELERMVERQNERRDELALRIQAEGIETITELAAESAEQLVVTTTKLKTYTRFFKALKARKEADQPPAETYATVSQYAFAELAKSASHLSTRNTSWQENERRVAEVVALGEVARLFSDVAKI